MKKVMFLVLAVIVLPVVFIACSKSSSPSAPSTVPAGDSPDTAIAVALGSSITGLTFDGLCDQDWFKVSVTSGTSYVLRTFDLTNDDTDPDGTGDTDTFMYVFTPDGKNALTTRDVADIEANNIAYNDDCASNCGSDPSGIHHLSTVNYTADFTGTLYIVVIPYECQEDSYTELDNVTNPGYSFEAIEDVI
ncbi:MAG: hypothetical protein JXR81_09615 [Candidatus Goldbacteria bacterium]|nr:hypothetical protein [Candidatus Goldiibacteriota bacterium]